MKNVDTLKSMLCHEKNLSAVLHYFFDLGDDHVIARLNSHTLEDLPKNGAYYAMLGAIRQNIHRSQHVTIDAKDSYFLVAPEHHFIHGAFVVKDTSIPVFYFNDIELGLYAIARGNTTDVYRFSLVSCGGLGLD